MGMELFEMFVEGMKKRYGKELEHLEESANRAYWEVHELNIHGFFLVEPNPDGSLSVKVCHTDTDKLTLWNPELIYRLYVEGDDDDRDYVLKTFKGYGVRLPTSVEDVKRAADELCRREATRWLQTTSLEVRFGNISGIFTPVVLKLVKRDDGTYKMTVITSVYEIDFNDGDYSEAYFIEFTLRNGDDVNFFIQNFTRIGEKLKVVQ